MTRVRPFRFDDRFELGSHGGVEVFNFYRDNKNNYTRAYFFQKNRSKRVFFFKSLSIVKIILLKYVIDNQ